MVSRNAKWGASIAPELRDWVDNRLVNAHVRSVQPMVLGTLLNAAVLVLCLGLELPFWATGLLAAMFAAASGHRYWLVRGVERRRRDPAGMAFAFQANSVGLGVGFGTFCAQALPLLGPDARLVLAVSAVTQIAAAAYTVRTLPRSAVLFIAPVTIGLALGFATLATAAALGAAVLLIAAAGLLIRMVFNAHDLFVSRILREREVTANTRTIKLLLNEFEQSGSDWLFELDREGRMLRVSDRFAEAAGRAPEDLNGHPFTALLEPGGGRDAIAQCLSRHVPFRDAAAVIATAAGPRWWSIGGRPAYASEHDPVAFRGVICDITHAKQAESRVSHMAQHDSLTGLPNRSLFNTALARLLDEREPEARVALLLVDVDHFKAVNDMYGHPVGDTFLREVATRMEATVAASGLGGDSPLVARLGGDEFAVIVSGEDAADHAIRLSELLRVAMTATFAIDSHELDTSVSIGVALAPDHAEVAGQLQVNADIALYAAKGEGRNRWELFEPGMDQDLHERHSLARDLRHAVARGELRLFLQPLIDLETEAKTGYEALLRWEHPERGLVMPDTFIPLAEETGLIVGIGEWVIRTAFAEAASWDGGPSISINLSPVQLGSPNLLPVVINALAETGLNPALVEFEITESVLLHNSDANIQVLNRLHELGLKVALDDFGTGYASLNYLLTFPFDKIKIDRSFIAEINSREESSAIVSAVIGLANSLGMCTLAEGVEDEAQLARLKQHGCRMVQGWLFGKAMPSAHYQPHAEPLRVIPEGPAPVRLEPALAAVAVARGKPKRQANG